MTYSIHEWNEFAFWSGHCSLVVNGSNNNAYEYNMSITFIVYILIYQIEQYQFNVIQWIIVIESFV